MGAWVTWRKDLSNLGKVLWGTALAPLSNLVDFIRGGVVFFYHLFKRTPYAVRSNIVYVIKNDKADIKARTIPFTSSLGRIGGIIATTLYILGFIGALVVPLPGIAPIYAISTAAIAKACGITLLSTLVGRGIGALIGSTIDTFYDKPIFDTLHQEPSTKVIVPVKKLEFILKATVTTALVGDQAILPELFHKHISLFNKEPTAKQQHALSIVSPVADVDNYSVTHFPSSSSQTDSDSDYDQETGTSLLRKNSRLNSPSSVVEMSPLTNNDQIEVEGQEPPSIRVTPSSNNPTPSTPVKRNKTPLPTAVLELKKAAPPVSPLSEAKLTVTTLLKFHPVDDRTPLTRSTLSSVSSYESEGVPMNITPQSKQSSPINMDTSPLQVVESSPHTPPWKQKSSMDMTPVTPLSATQIQFFSTSPKKNDKPFLYTTQEHERRKGGNNNPLPPLHKARTQLPSIPETSKLNPDQFASPRKMSLLS